MADKQPLEVLPSEDQWAVQRQEADRSLKNFDTKSEAMDYARELAKSEESSLIIKDSEGKVLESRNYDT